MDLKECVVVDCVRTPVGKSSRKGVEKSGGAFRTCSAQDLLITAIESVVNRVKAKSPDFDPKEIEDCAVGCLSQIGEQAGNIGRISILLAGLPYEIAGQTIDRYCNAGLQAVNTCANAIRVGDGDIMIAAGIESMTHYSMGVSMEVAMKAKIPVFMSERIAQLKWVQQGESAEMIADKYGYSRELMDKFGLWSHQKATKAMRNKEEYEKRVIPVSYTAFDYPDRSTKKKVTITEDQTVRPVCLDDPDKALEGIAQLKPIFRSVRKGGRVTAGNSSQIVDGAAACILMSREKAEKLGLKPMASIVSTAVGGDEPVIMLLGPVPAQKKALARAGKEMKDMNLIEPNEAFATPCLAFADEFGYDYFDPRVNPTGGAISIGHPIGASGVIYFTEMVHEMVNRNLKWGIQTMCGGGGVGIATVVKRD